MNEFEKCLGIVFGAEGGYVNDPVDRGGPTNMGVTAGTLKTAFERGLVGHHNVKILTRSEAAKIYEVLYWGPSKASRMPWPLNLLHFDAAVNHGLGGAGRQLQNTLNRILGDGAVTVDGNVGPKTLAALNPCLTKPENVRAVCLTLLDVRKAYFLRIVERDEKQGKFLKGWMNRLKKLRGYVDEAA